MQVHPDLLKKSNDSLFRLFSAIFLDNKYKNNLIAKRKTNVFYLVVSI